MRSTIGNGNGDTGVLEVSSRVGDLGDRMADAIDAKKDSIAQRIEDVAATLHRRTRRLPVFGRVAGTAHSVADAMEVAARRLRDRDTRRIAAELLDGVRRRPGAALLIAAAVGFVLARSLSRR